MATRVKSEGVKGEEDATLSAFDNRCSGFVNNKTLDEASPGRMTWDCVVCDKTLDCFTLHFYDSVKGHASRNHNQGDVSFLAVVFRDAYNTKNTTDVDAVALRLAKMVSMPSRH